MDIVDSSCQTALFSAADYGDLHIARVLVKECGAATDARDSEGFTPLLYAAHNGHSDVVRFLAKECGDAVDVHGPHFGRGKVHCYPIKGGSQCWWQGRSF